VPSVLKSGNLNLLEPSGPVQVCSGIALLFTNFVLRGRFKDVRNIICLAATKMNFKFLYLRMAFATNEVKGERKQVMIFLKFSFLQIVE